MSEQHRSMRSRTRRRSKWEPDSHMDIANKPNVGADSQLRTSRERLGFAPVAPGKDGKEDNIILKVEALKMHFPVTGGGLIKRKVGAVRAVDGIDFYIKRGETLGLVGESGCGKSTAGRAILQLYTPTAGRVVFKVRD